MPAIRVNLTTTDAGMKKEFIVPSDEFGKQQERFCWESKLVHRSNTKVRIDQQPLPVHRNDLNTWMFDLIRFQRFIRIPNAWVDFHVITSQGIMNDDNWNSQT